jgi:predicted enzyme related to lactoylglutathione lyase
MNVLGVQLSLVINPTEDYDNVVTFYCETLAAFELVEGNIRCKSDPRLQIGTVGILSGESSQARGRQAGDWPWLVLFVEDCDAVLKRLEAGGVRLDGQMINLPYGRQLSCFDPIGNRVCFFEGRP